jgi:hypothetical protein
MTNIEKPAISNKPASAATRVVPKIETYESKNAPEFRRWGGHFVKNRAVLPVRFFARDEESLIAKMTAFWQDPAHPQS